MSPIEVTSIIVSFNTSDLTRKAITSVLDNLKQDKIDGEVIVVDNNSSDSSVEQIQKEFGKKIILIENTKNVGFAQANNQGIKISQGKYVLLLNSDAQLHTHALKKLLDVFKKYPDNIGTAELSHTESVIDRVGIVSGQLFNADGSLQPQGGALPTLLNLSAWWLWPFPGSAPISSHHQYHIQDPIFFEKEQKIGWLSGAALLLRKELLNEVGPLDEAIFMYAEDVDLCVRASNHHWDCVYTPDAKITHIGSASSEGSEALAKEISGLLYVSAKHWSIWKNEVLKLIFILGSALRWFLFGIIQQHEKKQALYSRIFKSILQ